MKDQGHPRGGGVIKSGCARCHNSSETEEHQQPSRTVDNGEVRKYDSPGIHAKKQENSRAFLTGPGGLGARRGGERFRSTPRPECGGHGGGGEAGAGADGGGGGHLQDLDHLLGLQQVLVGALQVLGQCGHLQGLGFRGLDVEEACWMFPYCALWKFTLDLPTIGTQKMKLSSAP